MEIPSTIKCPICGNDMVKPDPKIVQVSPFTLTDPSTGKSHPPDGSTARICLKCGNVQQFIDIQKP